MIYTRNHLSRVITQNQETVAMTSTAVSKRVLNHKLHQNEDERTSNVMSAFSWSCVCIDIYFF